MWGGNTSYALPSTCKANSAEGAYAPPCATATSVAVTFREVLTTAHGETVYMPGPVSELGKWDTDLAIALSAEDCTAEDPAWDATNRLPVDLQVEYKYFKMRKMGRSDGRVVLIGCSLCLQDVPGRPRRGILGDRSKVDKSMGEASGGTAAASSVTVKVYDYMFVSRDIGIGRLA